MSQYLVSSMRVRAAATQLALVVLATSPLDCARADDVLPATRSIIALAETASDVDNFLSRLDVVDAPTGVFRQAFGGSKWSALAEREIDPEKTSSGVKLIMAAGADPYFERWQKDANERLKEEKAGKTVKPHPLAAANPGKSVVVCEAGCRTTQDEIVYIEEVVPAVLPPAQFEPSSSNGGSSPAVDDGSIPCIAGCYDRRETSEPVRVHKAEAGDAPAAVRKDAVASADGAEVAPSARQIARRIQTGFNGAIVERYRDASFRRALRSAKVRSGHFAALRAWRTKVEFAVPPAKRKAVLTGLRSASPHGLGSPRWRKIASR